MTLCVTAEHTLETANTYEVVSRIEEDQAKQVYRIEAREGVPIVIRKAVAYHTSRGVPVTELYDRCRRTLDRVGERGFDSRDSALGSTTSGPTRTLRWVANPAFSRPSVGVCSSWPKQRLARISSESPPKG